ncbi:MAG: GntR family transcriptional regulator [Beijerinckiaceae bacterium]
MLRIGPKRPASLRLAKQDSLSERIYLDLRSRLQRCEIGPDARLVDLEVASAYGTSRMPAREALLRLANEGYLVGTTRGFVTPRLSLDDIRDIFEVRRLLEPHAAANAARDLDDRGRKWLSEAIKEARAAIREDDVGRLILANIEFRACWLGALRNARLATTLARFVDHVQTVRLGTLRDPETRAVVGDGLEGLYDAFMRADSVAAKDRMAAFMAAAEQAFFSVRKAEIENEERAAAPSRMNFA